MKNCNRLIAAVCVVALASVAGFAAEPPAKSASPIPAVADATGGLGGAGLYYQWVTQCIDGIEKDLPAVTASAEAAAKLFVNDGYEIGAYGGGDFVRELVHRSGGVMGTLALEDKDKVVDKIPAKAVILVALRADRLDEIIKQAAQWKKDGHYVVIFGREGLLKEAASVGADFAMNNHADPNNGIIKGDKGYVVPTDSTANTIASWVWTAEFVGACTRLGKMPPMYQGYTAAGAKDREKLYTGVKFHDKPYGPVAAGDLAKQYIQSLRASLKGVYEDLPKIRQAAGLAVAAAKDGHKVYTSLMGHVTMRQLGYPGDPGLFTNLPAAKKVEPLKKGDVLIYVGFNAIPQALANRARAAAATIVWSTSAYDKNELKLVQDGEIFIDQRWGEGDAVAAVPGYDIKMLPTSGAISQVILWMICGEMVQPAGQPTPATQK